MNMKRHAYNIGFVLIGLIIINCSRNTKTMIKTFKLKSDIFSTRVTETGELQALNSNMVTAPNISWRSGNLKITYLIEEGSKVNTGDILAEFDRSDIQKQVIEAQSKLDLAKAELRKTQASHASEINDFLARIERAKIDAEISDLNYKQAAFESEIRRKELELEVETYKINLDKAIKDLENKRKVHAEEINKNKLTVSQEKNRLQELNTTLEKLTVKAPAPGIVILTENWSTGNKIQVEDQLWRGQPMISLPDMDTLQVKLQINEVDIAKIQLNQKSFVRMDALPDTSFSGFVEDVAVLAKRKERDSNVKIFDVYVQLTEMDTTMMPGMTVRCEIEVNRLTDTLFVPLDCIFKKESQSIVYLKKGSGFQEKEVVPGDSNDDYVIIAKGLKAGDEVALSDPTVFSSKKSADKTKKQGN